MDVALALMLGIGLVLIAGGILATLAAGKQAGLAIAATGGVLFLVAGVWLEARESSRQLDNDAAARAAVAARPDTTAAEYLQLGQDPSDLVRAAVAASTAPVAAEARDRLASDPSPNVRIALAANLHASVETLAALIADSDAAVAQTAVANPSVPAEMLSETARFELPDTSDE